MSMFEILVYSAIAVVVISWAIHKAGKWADRLP